MRKFVRYTAAWLLVVASFIARGQEDLMAELQEMEEEKEKESVNKHVNLILKIQIPYEGRQRQETLFSALFAYAIDSFVITS